MYAVQFVEARVTALLIAQGLRLQFRVHGIDERTTPGRGRVVHFLLNRRPQAMV